VVFTKNVKEWYNRIPQEVLKIPVRKVDSFTKIRVTIFILKINLIGGEM